MAGCLCEQLESYLAWCFEHQTPPRVQEWADQLGISRSTLHRRCIGELSDSPAHVIKRIQRHYARRLRTQKQLTRTELVLQAGFGTTRTLERSLRQTAPERDAPDTDVLRQNVG